MSHRPSNLNPIMPALIAEELNLPLSMVKVEIAGVAPVYINALFGGQITGGSTSGLRVSNVSQQKTSS